VNDLPRHRRGFCGFDPGRGRSRCFLAFGFGAAADVVATMLIVGVVTALAETKLRFGNKIMIAPS
jgi:hypothetical protein